MGKSVANKISVHLEEMHAKDQLSEHLHYLISKQEGLAMRPLVFLCIGSDRYTGDALGPLIGTMISEQMEHCLVYGTLDQPVHAGNLVETINIINHRYHHPVIVAIDACLGKKSEIGNIEAWEGGLQAGIAVGNRLPSVGHISVIGVVNAGGQVGYLDLQSTPLSIVMKLSKIISAALIGAVKRFTPETACPTSCIRL
ncbi:MAG: spore protease YyaC [Negativicutes bacterium]|nr:spore protease YyaC [Negativicutes bacterium]